ncbi:hypothetical protein NDU88_001683 [Pleurodeles waltl]|uniref:Uncharacterized protein n=1 Tax=Pleurodeles waltl TaxID=8319 RepID=A0AAV7VCI3_PLEWA|nr:hypothetical protein NDU88_001683 [Pleurodeles waltl]
MVQASSTVGWLEYADGTSRRKNVRLLGFPQRAEGSPAAAFMKNWIRDVLQPTGISRVFVVERAHRALVAPPAKGYHCPSSELEGPRPYVAGHL